MEYGGWYDNPETGRNQRWFNGVWTDGAEPTDPSQVEAGALLKSLDSSTDAYWQKLIDEAQGDYNLTLKKLEQAYTIALGSNDQATQDFLLRVADKAEEKLGRIPYDYEQMTSRELEDYGRTTERINTSTSKLLTRLKEDEIATKADMTLRQGDERQLQSEDLNSRGISDGMTRDNAVGLAGKNVNRLETDITARNESFDRLSMRDRQDALYKQKVDLEDAARLRDRNLQDLKTGARRGAIDITNDTQLGKESASNTLNKLKRSLEQKKKDEKLYNIEYSYGT